MEKFIQVYDDLIPNNLQDYVYEIALYKIPWFYTPTVAGPDTLPSPAMVHTFYNSAIMVDPQAYWESHNQTCMPYKPIFLNILYKVSNQLKFHISDIYTGRLFLHHPSPNPGPDSVHIDLQFPHWVCLYYLHDSDGDTILFKDDKKTEIKRVTPKKGRVVFFDGTIPHCSSRPTKGIRTILNFDFKAISSI